MDKADKKHVLRNKKTAAKHLLEAIYLLKKNETTVKEFDSLKMKSEITGEPWTIDYVKKRLLKAGYRPANKSP